MGHVCHCLKNYCIWQRCPMRFSPPFFVPESISCTVWQPKSNRCLTNYLSNSNLSNWTQHYKQGFCNFCNFISYVVPCADVFVIWVSSCFDLKFSVLPIVILVPFKTDIWDRMFYCQNFECPEAHDTQWKKWCSLSVH